MEEFPKPKPKIEKGPEDSVEQRFESSRKTLWEMVDQGVAEEERRKVIAEWQDREIARDEIEKEKPENKGIPRSVEEDLQYMVRVAQLYYAADFLDDSWNGFQDALATAKEAKRDDLAVRIQKLIDELTSG